MIAGDEAVTNIPTIASRAQVDRYGGTNLRTAYNAYNYSTERIANGDFIRLKEERQQSEQPLKEWGDIQILRGRYGMYIHTPKGNYQLPKGTDVQELTEQKVQQIIAQSEPIKAVKRFSKRKSAK